MRKIKKGGTNNDNVDDENKNFEEDDMVFELCKQILSLEWKREGF